MILRPARREDIPAMHALRMSVVENVLRDFSRVTHMEYERRVSVDRTSWVAECDGSIVGFAIADLPSRSIWALFVQPGFERRGIGRALLREVTSCLEAAGDAPMHLSTEEGTRAESVYLAAGWTRAGRLPNGEVHLVRDVCTESPR